MARFAGLNLSLPDGEVIQADYTYNGIGVADYESHTLALSLHFPLKLQGLPEGSQLKGSYALSGEDIFSSFSQLRNQDTQRFMLELSVPFH